MSREKLMQKNNVEKLKGKTDKQRIAELEQDNADLTDAIMELASIIAEESEE